MPTWAAASSSSGSPARERTVPAGSAFVVFRRDGRAFFVHGFAKNDRENLQRDELRALRELAKELLGLDEARLEAMLANGTIGEVNCDG